MRQILHIPLQYLNRQELTIPSCSEFITVKTKPANGEPYLCIIGDPDRVKIKTNILMLQEYESTGTSTKLQYLGTLNLVNITPTVGTTNKIITYHIFKESELY